MNTITPARAAAFRILLEVEKGHAHSDDLLRARFVNRMSSADRNLTTALVLGVLRWQIRLDQEIKKFLAKPNAKLDAEVRIALRLAALQLTEMERIPAHAAIAESVELAKQAGHSFASRMVNAVLRKLAAQAKGTGFSLKGTGFSPYDESTPEIEGASALALRYAHPAWLVERWIAAYGFEAARAICAHGQRQPALHLRLANQATEAELASEGMELSQGTLLASARTLVAGDMAHSLAFSKGRARVQDEGSQLVAELAAATAAKGTRTICDACAAPGGKTLILAERHSKAQIVACELSAPRAEELAKRLAPLAPRVTLRTMDAATLSADEAFDLILVDAPCTGTGTLGRNPEIRHRMQPEELARQAERQRALLAAALRAVRPGGRVVYSTCSLEREENDEVVATVLAEHPAARMISLAGTIDVLEAKKILAAGAAERLKSSLTAEGALRLLPDAMPTDGFFVALLEQID